MLATSPTAVMRNGVVLSPAPLNIPVKMGLVAKKTIPKQIMAR